MTEIALLLISFFAFLQDIRIHKIKNWYILITLLGGLAYQFGTGNSLAGLLGAVCGMIFYPLFMLRFMGAGDVKMFCVLGAWAAFPKILPVMIYCVLTNGVIAAFFMLCRKNGFKLFRSFWLWVKVCILSRTYIPMSEEQDRSDKYPYMIGVFLGVVLFVVTGGQK